MSLFAYGNTARCQMEINEDSYVVKKIGDYIVLMVADGNGGSKGMINVGTLATNVMVDYLTHLIKPTTSIIDIYNFIESGMFTASRCFLSINAIDEKYSNVYASMSVVVIEEISLNMVVASIGNTELRLIRNGQITRVNKLFSEAYDLYIKNEIDEFELYSHPKRAILTSALGVFDEACVDVVKTQLMQEDILLLSSDGLYRCMSPQQIVEKLAKNGDDISKAVDGILQDADKLKCPDNCTLICGYVYNDNGASIDKTYTPQVDNTYTGYNQSQYEKQESTYNESKYSSDKQENDTNEYYNQYSNSSTQNQKKKKKYLYY